MKTATTYADEPLRRAAVLMTCLERPEAEALLARIGSAAADRLRRAIATLGPVAGPEREDAMHAFLQSPPSLADRHDNGVELDPGLARRLGGTSIDSADASGTEDQAAKTPFAFLLETESDVVAPFLARENPQTIAVVLSFLRRGKAAELLQRLDTAVRGQVLKRLASLDEIDPASIDVVAAELRAWLARQRETSSLAGRDNLVRDLLAKGGERDRAQLILDLQQATRPAHASPTPPAVHGDAISGGDRGHGTGDRTRTDPLLVATGPQRRKTRRTVAFGGLLQLANEDLVNVVQAAPHEVLALALAGADERLVERIMNLLPRRNARHLKRGIQLQGPIRLADIEDAQRTMEMIATKILSESAPGRTRARAHETVGPLGNHWA